MAVTLPAPPSPTSLEIVSEEDPFTIEWEVRQGPGKTRILILAAGEAALLAALGAAFLLLKDPLARNLVIAFLVTLSGVGSVLVLRAGLGTGRGRLVLHPDSLIWVPGDGGIPQVWRKSEVRGAEARSRSVDLVVDEGRRRIAGNFLKQDPAWLAGVIRTWRGA